MAGMLLNTVALVLVSHQIPMGTSRISAAAAAAAAAAATGGMPWFLKSSSRGSRKTVFHLPETTRIMTATSTRTPIEPRTNKSGFLLQLSHMQHPNP